MMVATARFQMTVRDKILSRQGFACHSGAFIWPEVWLRAGSGALAETLPNRSQLIHV
jgi:hypothetical protein